MLKNLIMLLAASTLLAGCLTMDSDNQSERLLSTGEITGALSSAKPPQQFGFSVYPIGEGIAMNGSARLHPLHTASVDSKCNDAPVIKMRGSASRMKLNALIDPISPHTWFKYDTAIDFRGSFMGFANRQLPYRGKLNIGAAQAFAGVIPQLRIDQLLIENIPVYIRMATGSIGPLNRGIQSPDIDALLGYDLLRNFEYIQFDPITKKINFSASGTYTPNPSLLIGRASIVNQEGVGLAIAGAINGKPTPILLDFAGNYLFAVNQATKNVTQQIDLGEVVYINTPTQNVITSDRFPRAGLSMLMKYKVTICPRINVVYFEQPLN